MQITKKVNKNEKINPEASTFLPKRTTAVIALIKLNDVAEGTDI